MNIAIRYFTKSKKGNTIKLADAVSTATGIAASDINRGLDEKVDRLFLINAMYAANIDNEVKEFLSFNKDKIGELVNFSTSATGRSTWSLVKAVADELGIPMNPKEFHCKASWIFINKGLPSEDDFRRAGDFAKSMME